MDEKKFSLKPGYVLREIAGEYLAVPINTDNGAQIIVLNPVSYFIWKELSAPKTLEEIVNAVKSEFDVSQGEATVDIMEFLAQLESYGCLES